MTPVPATLTLAPLSITTRARRNRSQHREPFLLRAMRRLWATCERCRDQATCDRCGDPMLDSSVSGFERICIRCVRDEAHVEAPLESRPQDAAAAMALRALLKELDFCLSGAGRLSELLRADAVLHTADILLGWLTPQNLRGPHYSKLDEQALRHHLRRFDDAWGLRTGGTSLIGLYDGWRKLQDKQQTYDKLAQTDTSYAQLLREGVR